MKKWRLPLLLGVLAIVVIGALALRPPPPPPPPSSSDSGSTSVSPSSSAAASSSAPRVLGRATVAIFDDGQPLVDRVVVFHDANGNVMASLKSGTDGKASSDVSAGSMITVAYGTSIRELVTVVGVEPGDEVLIGERENDEDDAGNTVAMAKVVLPNRYASATRYGVSLGVGTTDVLDPTTPQRMPILERFVSDDRKFPVLALAFGAHADGGNNNNNNNSGDALAFAFTWGVLAPGNDSGAAAVADTEVRLPAWSTDWREQRIILSNAPSGLTNVIGELAIVAGEDRFERGRRDVRVDADKETSLRFLVPRPLGDTSVFELAFAYGGSEDRAIVARRSKSTPEPDVRLDLRDALLPRVSAAVVERDRARPERPVVRWTATATARTPLDADATVVQVSWPETREHVWTIVAPPNANPRFELPALPPSLADWRPDAVRPIRAAVALVESSACRGYDEVRKNGLHSVIETPEDDGVTNRRSITGDIVLH